MMTLKIDPEFQSLIPPLAADEYKELKASILKDGCREAICVWYATIVDGHNRYEICTKHQIPVQIKKLYFKNREEVIAWICTTQLGRHNISEMTRRYLIGKRYEMEKILGIHNAAGTNQYKEKKERALRSQIATRPQYEKSSCRARDRLGTEYRLSTATVGRYGAYTRAMDKLSCIIPVLAPKILSGQIKITQEKIIALAALPSQEIRGRCGFLLSEPSEFVPYSVSRQLVPDLEIIPMPPSEVQNVTIKDMPAYDPDADTHSLALTIPSWVSAMKRTLSAAQFEEVSLAAKDRLQQEISKLQNVIDAILKQL